MTPTEAANSEATPGDDAHLGSTKGPRADKVAVVDEVKELLNSAAGVFVTEYRGLSVEDLADLRTKLAAVGSNYKIYKNTLVRIAAKESGIDLGELVGPTALAAVIEGEGAKADVPGVAKALVDFAKRHDALVIKGVRFGSELLDEAGARELATLPSGPEIYSRLAGALNSGARGTASALSGVYRAVGYAVQAAIDAEKFDKAA